jgi:hypothetical protein
MWKKYGPKDKKPLATETPQQFWQRVKGRGEGFPIDFSKIENYKKDSDGKDWVTFSK